jgi:hypothetical protein
MTVAPHLDEDRDPGVEAHGDTPERDAPPTGRILAQLALLGALVVAALLGLYQVFVLLSSAEIESKDLSRPSPELAELRARDRGRLSDWGVVDADAGVYRVPIEQAMRMLVANPSLLEPSRSGSGAIGESDGGSNGAAGPPPAAR